MSNEAMDVVISFDTTGSMYSYLAEVRTGVDALVRRLFDEIPDLRMGVMAHGDYVDAKSSYLLRKVDLTDQKDAILEFIKTVPATGGGDAPEAYEYALHEARTLAWREGVARVLLLIGDEVPHGPKYEGNTAHLDWHTELAALADSGVRIYGMQAGNKPAAKTFFRELSERTGGTYLSLKQLKHISDTILGIAMRERGEEHLSRYAVEVAKAKRMDSGLGEAFRAMLGRELTEAEATGREPGAEAAAEAGSSAKRVARKTSRTARAAAPSSKAKPRTRPKPKAKRPAARRSVPKAAAKAASRRDALARGVKTLSRQLFRQRKARAKLASRLRASARMEARVKRRLTAVTKVRRRNEQKYLAVARVADRLARDLAKIRARLAKLAA